MYVELEVDFGALRQLSSYEEWMEKLREELAEVYEVPREISSIRYSTSSNPNLFSSEMNEKIFGVLKDRDDNTEKIATLSAEYEDALAARQQRESERDPEKRMTRKERKADEEEKTKLRAMQKDLLNKEYGGQCLTLKLKNFERIHAIRVLTAG